MNRVAEALKDNRIVIYNNHAFLLAAETVAEAFLLAYMLNQACELQVKILSTGDPVITPDADACERHYASYYGNPNARYDGSAEWPGLLRSLDRVDSSYRD
jgi:ribulose-5-phosphate 4-epimerase/fuculose-1-phosphate aldolase